MSRQTYRNGDYIQLQANGCDGCKPAMINGTLCHETGCPDRWRDTLRACWQCGYEFYPTSLYDTTCESCLEPLPFQ